MRYAKLNRLSLIGEASAVAFIDRRAKAVVNQSGRSELKWLSQCQGGSACDTYNTISLFGTDRLRENI